MALNVEGGENSPLVNTYERSDAAADATTALERVREMCRQLSTGLRPHPEVTGEEWARWLLGYNGTVPVARRCPLCGDRLSERTGRHGLFFGCDSYPDCRHTENAGRRSICVQARTVV